MSKLCLTAQTLELNTVGMRLCMQDLNQENAAKRVLGGSLNSIMFEAGHMISGRCRMAKLLGLEIEDKWAAFFANDAAITDNSDYPKLEEVQRVWNDVSERLLSKLKSISDEEAAAEIPNAFPMHEKTVAGAFAFLTWHDSYHLGQVGAIRTKLGLIPFKSTFHQTESK